MAILPDAQRDQLITEHLGFVRAIAASVKKTLSSHSDFSELVSFGSTGLVEAAERYDPSRNIAFSTFAYYRIRGAIFDGLRQTGWLSRSQQARFAEASHRYLENRSEREPTNEPAPSATETLLDVTETLQDLATIFVTSLDAPGRAEPADTRTPGACEALEEKQLGQLVREAVKDLPDKERRLVELYYFEGLSLEEAGQRLGLSKSWSSRLHARAVRLLSRRLGHVVT